MNGVTIRELMEMPLLKDARVISGFEGMDRVVRFIDIMEVPDLRGWLREGELLLTTASPRPAGRDDFGEQSLSAADH